MSNEKPVFMLGDEAIAEGAIAAGCNFFAGYPITPSSEVLEYVARRFVEFPDRVYIQMEDEIGSMAAIIGASWTGAKAMTATSGPGFSLMQENLSYAYMTETPVVVAVVQRSGPSTGQATLPAQQEFYQARYGAHGDYEAIVLSPWSVQEMFDFTVRAFNLAEILRQPVILLTDGELGHLREKVVIPDTVETTYRKLPQDTPYPPFKPDDDLIPPMPLLGQGHKLLVTGSTHDETGFRNTEPEVHRQLVNRLIEKVQSRIDEISEFHFEKDPSGDAEIILVSYGATARPTYQAVQFLRNQGKKVDFLRLKTLWPFHEKKIAEYLNEKKFAVVTEMSTGKLVLEIERVANAIGVRTVGFGKIGGVVHTSHEIVRFVSSISD